MQETWLNPWVGKIHWRRNWQTIPAFLPGESHGQRSPAGYTPWGCKEMDITVWRSTQPWQILPSLKILRGKDISFFPRVSFSDRILFHLDIPKWSQVNQSIKVLKMSSEYVYTIPNQQNKTPKIVKSSFPVLKGKLQGIHSVMNFSWLDSNGHFSEWGHWPMMSQCVMQLIESYGA